MKLLSTKILNDESRKLIFNSGIDLVEYDFITTEKLPFDVSLLPEKINYAVFTSAHAVEYFLELNLHLEIELIAAISGKTKDLLIQNEFKVNVFDVNAEKLAVQILKTKKLKQIHFFCGEKRLSHLKNVLNKSGVVVNEHILYSTFATPHKIEIIKELDAILFFSPSGVESYLSLNSINPLTKCFCLGETTKKKLNEKGVTDVYISEKPIEKLLVDYAIDSLSQTKSE